MQPELENIGQFADLLNLKSVSLFILGILVIIALTKYLERFSKNFSEKFPSNRLLILQIFTVIVFAIYIFGTSFVVYAALRPSKEIIGALLTSGGVAVGFALKDLVLSFIAGIVLLFDRPFQVGDRVTFADTYGEITNIGLRAVRLTTLDDNLITIPNSKIINELVSSGNAGALDMMVCVSFHLSIEEDVEKVTEILKEIVLTSRFIYLKKPVNVVVTEAVLDRIIVLKFTVKAYVLDVVYEKAFETDIVSRTTKTFSTNNIKRPQMSV